MTLRAQHSEGVVRTCTFSDADGAVGCLGAREALAAGATQARLGLLLRPIQLSRGRLCGSCRSHTENMSVTRFWNPLTFLESVWRHSYSTLRIMLEPTIQQ